MLRRSSQSGAALLLVLWVVALLSAMAAALLWIVTRSSHSASGLLQRTELQAVADSAINQAIWQFISGGAMTPPRIDGAFRAIEVVGGAARVAISDEAGRIDLNEASPELLEALVKSPGADPVQAKQVADGIVHGPSSSSAAGDAGRLAVTDLWGLQRVPGMTPELYRSLLPLVTIYTRSLTVDTRYAPSSVLQVLVGAHQAGAGAVAGNGGSPDSSQSLSGRVLRLEALVSKEKGAEARYTEIIRIGPGQVRPYDVLVRWSD